MAINMTVAYAVLGVYLLMVLGSGVVGAWFTWRSTLASLRGAQPVSEYTLTREHFMAGAGLGTLAWFFSMASSLFSGYSVNGIVREAFTTGWMATRWIPAGVGVYIGFMVLAPRCHALGKQRGYMTISELIFDRYLPPHSKRTWVAHALRLGTFACLQLPIFTYLITQFQSVGSEVSAFTGNGITSQTAILVAAAVLFICDMMGGMRAVAYSDVIQGMVLLVGSIIFLILQATELGGLPAAKQYWSDRTNLAQPRVANMQLIPTRVQIVSYFDFTFKTTVAATTFPHLCQRLFCSRSANVMKRGMAMMNFTYFIVQLSSMVMGWTAVSALRHTYKGGSPFGHMLVLVAEKGGGQAFAAALLLASAICAMMSTADSAMLAFSTMWVRDLFKPYLFRRSTEFQQLMFGKLMAFVGLSIGVGLAIKTLQSVPPKPDLSALFSLQNVTPIHVAPAVWLGLHWRGLRGEAVAAGMVCGLGVTLGLVFSDKNLALKVGNDMLSNGLSSAWVGFCVNMFVTVSVGLLQQWGPALWARYKGAPNAAELMAAAAAGLVEEEVVMTATDAATTVDTVTSATPGNPGSAASSAPPTVWQRFVRATAKFFRSKNNHGRWLDIGRVRDTILHPALVLVLFLLLLFSIPIYRKPTSPIPFTPGVGYGPIWKAATLSFDMYVGSISSWAFTSLFISGIVAIITAYAYLVMWTDYEPMPLPLPKVLPGSLPSLYAKGMHVDDAKALSVDAKPSVTEISLSPLSDSS